MSSIASLTSTPALAQLNTHQHGHKKGSHVASADDSDSSSSTAAPVPAGTQKNLFGSLLQSLEQVIGVQLSAAAPAAATSAAAAPATAAAAASQHAISPQIAGSKVNVVA